MIKVGVNSGITSYQSNLEICDTTKTSNTGKTGRTSDYVELSSEGKEALINSKKGGEKLYDLSKVMEIHKKGLHEIPTKEESDYYWQARKSDQALDSLLYEQDKAEVLKIMVKSQSILMKVLSGKPLTPEEKEMVKNDPNLQQEIQICKIKAQLFK